MAESHCPRWCTTADRSGWWWVRCACGWQSRAHGQVSRSGQAWTDHVREAELVERLLGAEVGE